MNPRTLFVVALLWCGSSVLYAGTRPEDILRETVRRMVRISPEEALERYRASENSDNETAKDRRPTVLQAEEMIVSDDEEVESEVHAAVNPTDTANIIISPIKQSATPPATVCVVYYTKDFGKTWKKSSFMTVPKEQDAIVIGGGDPMLTFGADGTAYLSWINLYIRSSNPNTTRVAMYWASSKDGGATWTRAENDLIGAAEAQGFSFTEFFDKQWLAVDRTASQYHNTLYCALFHPNVTTADIEVARKTPGSSAFSPTYAKVSTPEFSTVQFTSIDVDPAGNVHVTFFGQKGDTLGLWHSVSTDGAETFSQPNIISTMHSPRFSSDEPTIDIIGLHPDRYYPCPQFAIDKSNGAHQGALYAVWTANGVTTRLDNGLDIYFSRSTDNGASWSAPVVVNDDQPGTGSHQFYPSIAVNDNGVISITWYDRRHDPQNIQTMYYMTHSFDGGLTFRPNAPVSTSASDFSKIGQRNQDFGIGEYTQVVTTKGHAIPVWADGRANNGGIDIYAAFVPISPLATGVVDRLSSVSEHVSVHVAPNPVSDNLSVEVALNAPSTVEARITDLFGRTVLALAHTAFEIGTHRLTADVSTLPPGGYYLHVNTQYGTSVKALNIVR